MILAFLAGVAAKIAQVDPRDSEIAKLKAQIDHLERECNDWRRIAQEWREIAIRSIPLSGRYPAQQAAMQQQAQVAQHNAGMNQGIQLLGAQTLENGLAQLHCNCTPGRHDLLLQG
jgi:multidrug resistance efflux pump